MRRSLLFRLLGLSLAVAVFAIAATAWLTMRDTGERFRGEFERTLEVDTIVYQALTAYALDNDSWDDVDLLVADLAEDTGQRVALTSSDGEVLADSAALSGQAGKALPSTPTAEIDALSLPSTHVSDVAVDSELPAVPVPEEILDDPTAESEIAEDVPTTLFALETLVPWSEGPRAWRMTDDEARQRRELADQAAACLREALGDDIEVTPSGEILVFEEEPGGQPQPADRLDYLTSDAEEVVLDCIPDELSEPSQAALELNEQGTRLLEECFNDADVPYTVRVGDQGFRQVVPGFGQPEDDEVAVECTETAWKEAMAPFVAEPALLYTGTTERFDPFFGEGWWRTTLAGLAVLAAATGVTVLAGRRLTRPISALTAAARRMGSGDHSARVEISGGDEVGQLAKAFNSMAESIETNEAQRRAMVSDVAHELRTPLANVRGYLEAAEDGVVALDPSLVTSLLEESTLLQRLVDDLQDLALADAGMLRLHPEDTDAAELARQIAAAYRTRSDEAGVTLTLDAPERVVAHTDPVRLRQALGNLVGNAVQYTPAGGAVIMRVRRDGDDVVLSVSDTGPGIAAEHVPHLFDRFYRADGSRSRATGGSGLGLAITKHLAEAHGGSVQVSTEPGRGSVFTLHLPRDHERSAAV